ncbi:hypothetical protein SDC9_21732 [bioreactor metagenome]|uniref:Uncharacterized protein n=1 Tax=bioreactor metagenome TaxID=1076179 RepID=A0A644UAJ7_9ZZZZ|nr:hypothetical protein [Candidatus Elulimicrobiales bacterium]
MAYIPTIRTFEDDINDNRGFDEAPISGGIEKINKKSDILVPEKKDSSLTKKVLTFIAILFIAASLAILGYYFYNKYLERQEEARLISEANQRQEQQLAQDGIQNDLSKILPKLAPGISPYIEAVVQKNNIIVLTIRPNNTNIDNYSALFAYILANKRDLNSDLFHAFKIQNISSGMESFGDIVTTPFTNDATSSTSIDQNTLTPIIITAKPMSSNDVVWESKTLNNQDFEIADAGLMTILYGYVNKKYLIMTTSQFDFLETVRSIQVN